MSQSTETTTDRLPPAHDARPASRRPHPPPRQVNPQSPSSARAFSIVSWALLLVCSVLWLVPSLWAIKTSLTPNEVSALGAGPILQVLAADPRAVRQDPQRQ